MYQADEYLETLKKLKKKVPRITRYLARENSKKPGQAMFKKTKGPEAGKIGFPARDSVPFNIGDYVEGYEIQSTDKFFIFKVIRVKNTKEYLCED